MEKKELQNYLLLATEAALAGGLVLKNYWGKLSGYQEKTLQGDLVTEADQESERQVIAIIKNSFPNHTILAEESGLISTKQNHADFLWAIDPLDGTTNYAHGFPMVCVSIGLLYKGKPIMGVVYNPILNELYQAASGLGAVCNGKTIKVSAVAELKRSLLATGFAYDRVENPDTNYEEFFHLTTLTHGVRRMGSAAMDLCYVACGRLDGFWERGLKIWDVAAGVVMIEEAGGRVSAYDLSPVELESGRVLATNNKIHDSVSAELLKVSKKQANPH